MINNPLTTITEEVTTVKSKKEEIENHELFKMLKPYLKSRYVTKQHEKIITDKIRNILK